MVTVSSRYTGTRCAPLELKLEPRQCMNFAAGIDDANERYLNDAAAEGVVAPPMLAVALSWKLSGSPQRYWAGTDFPIHVLQRQVHYLEALQWRRPMLPGERLTLHGECVAIVPHRAGTLILMEYEALDEAGEWIFREQVGGLLRGLACADEGSGHERVPHLGQGIEEEVLWEEPLDIDVLAAHRYDAGADIHFPIHTSPAFARQVGLPGTIYQGTATLARAVSALLRYAAEGDPRRLNGVSCQFAAMVSIPSVLFLQVLKRTEQVETTDLYFRIVKENGERALRSGVLKIAGKV